MIIETDDAFEMRPAGLVVVGCRSDSSLSRLELDSPDAKWTIMVEGSFSMTSGTGEERDSRLADLVGESVLLVRARKADGQLELRFTRDWVLTVHPDPGYEAWEMSSTRGERLVAVPGDGIAIWRAET